MNCAAIDIGTNSCRLLVASLGADGLISHCSKTETTRIGEGINGNGNISEPAMNRTINCLLGFKDILQEYQVKAWRVVATSALRQADNREEFMDLVRQKAELEVQVINSEEEARLSYLGVKKGLPSTEIAPVAGRSSRTVPLLPVVVDLGGGSMEIIVDDGELSWLSLPLGAVRAMESNMSVVEIAGIISSLALFKTKAASRPLVAVGGTASSLVAIKLAMEVYLAEMVHGQILTREEIADLYNMLERMSLRLRRRLPGLQPERADIIPWGALIILLLMDYLGKKQIIVSESDSLEGIIWQLQGFGI